MGVPPEALLRSAYTMSLIQFRAKQLCRKPGFNRSDEEDLVQQLKIALLQQAVNYDPRRGASVETFANRVVLSAVAMILRDRHRLKRAPGFHTRSLDRSSVVVQGRPVPLRDLVGEASRCRSGGGSGEDTGAGAELAEAVASALNGLPPELLTLAKLLMKGTPAAAARSLGISQRQLYADMDAIRRRFRGAGLEER